MGYTTSEKQTPSPISMAADIREAIEAQRKSGRMGQKTPLKDCLTATVALYTKLCTNKRHRIESNRRSLVYNMFLDKLSADLPMTYFPMAEFPNLLPKLQAAHVLT